MNYLEWVKQLKAGETITRTARGNSMTPRIYSGQEVTIEPVADASQVEVGDAVFCKVNGHFYVHRVYAVRTQKNKTTGERRTHFLIGNNHGHHNGWTHQVYGRVTRVEWGRPSWAQED